MQRIALATMTLLLGSLMPWEEGQAYQWTPPKPLEILKPPSKLPAIHKPSVKIPAPPRKLPQIKPKRLPPLGSTQFGQAAQRHPAGRPTTAKAAQPLVRAAGVRNTVDLASRTVKSPATSGRKTAILLPNRVDQTTAVKNPRPTGVTPWLQSGQQLLDRIKRLERRGKATPATTASPTSTTAQNATSSRPNASPRSSAAKNQLPAGDSGASNRRVRPNSIAGFGFTGDTYMIPEPNHNSQDEIALSVEMAKAQEAAAAKAAADKAEREQAAKQAEANASSAGASSGPATDPSGPATDPFPPPSDSASHPSSTPSDQPRVPAPQGPPDRKPTPDRPNSGSSGLPNGTPLGQEEKPASPNSPSKNLSGGNRPAGGTNTKWEQTLEKFKKQHQERLAHPTIADRLADYFKQEQRKTERRKDILERARRGELTERERLENHRILEGIEEDEFLPPGVDWVLPGLGGATKGAAFAQKAIQNSSARRWIRDKSSGLVQRGVRVVKNNPLVKRVGNKLNRVVGAIGSKAQDLLTKVSRGTRGAGKATVADRPVANLAESAENKLLTKKRNLSIARGNLDAERANAKYVREGALDFDPKSGSQGFRSFTPDEALQAERRKFLEGDRATVEKWNLKERQINETRAALQAAEKALAAEKKALNANK